MGTNQGLHTHYLHSKLLAHYSQLEKLNSNEVKTVAQGYRGKNSRIKTVKISTEVPDFFELYSYFRKQSDFELVRTSSL